ncbi:homoserine kinase [Geochorda subterranea]|uniref:Homoserine kinase n=1 Tax=Geochorda subterranea TaxID=3109564 RepID=A0ABZ1BLA7_9FIRM|nr:homoserine kinase [Limnochorda sp. LNt]WRP13231.1 homoserine kinase [Limnochorda sp. LNt]
MDETPVSPIEAAWVDVPASTANLGPGFDALGLALELRLRVTMRWVATEGGPQAWPPALAGLTVTGEGAGRIERGAANRLWQAAQAVFGRIEAPSWARGRAVEVEAHNAIPVGAGLGSSAAAAVAGLWAANALAGSPLSYGTLLEMAAAMEGHADNAAAAALGGLVVARRGRTGAVTAIRVPLPRGELVAALAVPDFALPTERARRVLPATVSREDAVFNVGGASLTVAALTTGRFEVLAEAMADRLHQPHRSALVPGLDAAMEAAVVAGAYGAALSGAGPSVVALCPSHRGDEVAVAMAGAMSRNGLQVRAMVLPVATEGARLRVRRRASAPGAGGDERESG